MIGPKQVTGVDVPDLPGNLLDPDGLPDLSAKTLALSPTSILF